MGNPTGPGEAAPTGTAGTTGTGTAVAVVALPLAVLLVFFVELGTVVASVAGAQPPPVGCGGGGTAVTVRATTLDAEQMSNAQTIVTVTAGRRLPAYAAVVAVATAYQESKLRNTLQQLDHDSEGLFQLRVSLWGKQAADDPVRSTSWFLDRLAQVPNWQTIPLTQAAQAVQRSAYPDAYAPWQPLAAALVGQLWPSAAARSAATTASTSAATTASTSAATSTVAASSAPAAPAVLPAATMLCPNSGDGLPAPVVGASITVPAGLSMRGSLAGITAARSALAQLGKPYLWGAAGPDAFDCSGLTMAAWASAGVALPHFTGDQVNRGIPSPTDLSLAVTGDLVFIAGSDGSANAPRHVGIVAGYVQQPAGRQLLIVTAPHSGTVVQLIDARRWASLIVAVRHLS